MHDPLTLSIASLDSRGRGVARARGKVVFVPFALPGEAVTARVVRSKARYDEAALIEILEPSPRRVSPPCPVFGRCGGCALQHMDYAFQLEHKQAAVAGALARIAGLDVPVEPALAMADPWRYRNKAGFLLNKVGGRWAWGYRAAGSHDLVPTGDCLLTPPAFAGLARAAVSFLQKSDVPEGAVTGLTVRAASCGETLVVLTGPGEPPAGLAGALKDAGAGSVLWRGRGGLAVLAGRDFLMDTLGPLTLRVAAEAFAQVNPAQAARLYTLTAERAALTGRETVVDLYCGAGAIGLWQAGRAGRVLGVEADEAAVSSARENAGLNGIENASFLRADAAEGFARMAAQGLQPDVVVVDPPRRGCADGLPALIAGTGCPRVVYVSCDPATLARDLGRFIGLGYLPGPVAAVDMFAQTEHVETVVLMSRVDK